MPKSASEKIRDKIKALRGLGVSLLRMAETAGIHRTKFSLFTHGHLDLTQPELRRTERALEKLAKDVRTRTALIGGFPQSATAGDQQTLKD